MTESQDYIIGICVACVSMHLGLQGMKACKRKKRLTHEDGVESKRYLWMFSRNRKQISFIKYDNYAIICKKEIIPLDVPIGSLIFPILPKKYWHTLKLIIHSKAMT